MVQLDSTNLRLLALLQDDARMSVIDLARAVDRAESTVRERLVAMERDGVLKGYRAVVDAERLGYKARALVRADCDPRRLQDVARRLASVPNVASVALTTGPKPLVIELLAESAARIEQVVEQRLAPLDLPGMEVELVLRTLVEPRPVQASVVQAVPERGAELPALRPPGRRWPNALPPPVAP
jgi:DNA-binding Lrp family transcriptional regulator